MSEHDRRIIEKIVALFAEEGKTVGDAKRILMHVHNYLELSKVQPMFCMRFYHGYCPGGNQTLPPTKQSDYGNYQGKYCNAQCPSCNTDRFFVGNGNSFLYFDIFFLALYLRNFYDKCISIFSAFTG